jgi:hypothetical protein
MHHKTLCFLPVKWSGACAPFRLLFDNCGAKANKKNNREDNLDNVQDLSLHRVSPVIVSTGIMIKQCFIGCQHPIANYFTDAKRMASVGGKIKANHPPPTQNDHQFSSYIKNGFMSAKQARKRGRLGERETITFAHA